MIEKIQNEYYLVTLGYYLFAVIVDNVNDMRNLQSIFNKVHSCEIHKSNSIIELIESFSGQYYIFGGNEHDNRIKFRSDLIRNGKNKIQLSRDILLFIKELTNLSYEEISEKWSHSGIGLLDQLNDLRGSDYIELLSQKANQLGYNVNLTKRG